MISYLVTLLVGFVAGALVFRKHSVAGNSIADKGKDLLAKLKGK